MQNYFFFFACFFIYVLIIFYIYQVEVLFIKAVNIRKLEVKHIQMKKKIKKLLLCIDKAKNTYNRELIFHSLEKNFKK